MCRPRVRSLCLFLLLGAGLPLLAQQPAGPTLANDLEALQGTWIQESFQTETRIILGKDIMRVVVIRSYNNGRSRGKDFRVTHMAYRGREEGGKRSLVLSGRGGKPSGSVTYRIDGVRLILSGYFSGTWTREGAVFPKKGEAVNEANALTMLGKLKAELTRDSKAPGTPVVDVLLNGTAVADANLPFLKALPSIRVLGLTQTFVTDTGLSALKDIRDLQTLSLRRTRITNAGLVHLQQIKGLKHLSLQETCITDKGLPHLKGCQALEQLDLRSTGVKDAGLAHLVKITTLKQLSLFDTPITDAGVAHLKGLPDLVWLGLSGTKVTDAGLAHLQGLNKLETLALKNTAVTDKGLVLLKGLSSLRRLSLPARGVTNAGVSELQKALPKCKVLR